MISLVSGVFGNAFEGGGVKVSKSWVLNSRVSLPLLNWVMGKNLGVLHLINCRLEMKCVLVFICTIAANLWCTLFKRRIHKFCRPHINNDLKRRVPAYMISFKL